MNKTLDIRNDLVGLSAFAVFHDPAAPARLSLLALEN
jgi:hypothetical protein